MNPIQKFLKDSNLPEGTLPPGLDGDPAVFHQWLESASAYVLSVFAETTRQEYEKKRPASVPEGFTPILTGWYGRVHEDTDKKNGGHIFQIFCVGTGKVVEKSVPYEGRSVAMSAMQYRAGRHSLGLADEVKESA